MQKEYSVFKEWTYLPRRMTNGKLVWWTEYYEVQIMIPTMLGLDYTTVLYSKEDWFIECLSMDYTKYFSTPDFTVHRQKKRISY